MAGVISIFLVVLVTVLVPPLGIFMISGCSVDLCVNILLTLLGYIPGLIHALYLEHVFYSPRNTDQIGEPGEDAPGVYSDRIQHGPRHFQSERTYGTV